MRYIKIPKERVGVLIGHDGETKRTIEQRSHVKLIIDSKLGEIQIDDTKASDPLMGLKTENIVQAIGRGFSPEHALRLFDDDTYFLLLDLRDYVGRKEPHMKRVKARIIGRDGRTKHILENMTNSVISVYGHTVSVITTVDYLETIKTALEMVIGGNKHRTVYRFLQRRRKEQEFAAFNR